MSRFNQPGTLRTQQIGSVRVSYLPDGCVKMVPRFLFPETTDADWARNAHHLDDAGHITISSGGLLIESGDRAILVDVGYGPYPEPVSNLDYGMASTYGGGLLDSLRALGREPGEIEAVVISHLHVEHVGWAAHPELAHAAFRVSEPEWAGRVAEHGVTQQVLDAVESRLRPVADGEELLPGVRAVALPGHTPGQMGFEVTAGGQRLLGFADVLHSPVQVDHPQWPLVGENDRDECARMRHHVLERLAQEDTVGFGMHFADVAFGRVIRKDDGFSWDPLP